MRRASKVMLGCFGAVLAGVAGSAYADIWLPDIPPVSPETENDEFDGASLDSKWLEWDPGSAVMATVDTSRQALKLSAAGNGGSRWGGVYQAKPDNEFVVYAKLGVLNEEAGQTTGALFIAEDISGGAASTADFRTAEVLWSSSSMRWETRHWSAYNGSVSAASTRAEQPLSAYVRMRVKNSTCAVDFSADGVGWSTFTSITLPFTPTHFGVALNQISDNLDGILLVDFVRVFSGTDTSKFTETKIGGLL